MKQAREVQAVKPLIVVNRQEDGSYAYSSGEGASKVSFEEKDVTPVVFVESHSDGTYRYVQFSTEGVQGPQGFPTEEEWNALVARVEALENTINNG